MRERQIALIGLFAVLSLLIIQVFPLLSPIPDSPEISRAKAEVILIKAEMALQNAQLYRVFLVSGGIIAAGLIMCFGAVVVALSIIGGNRRQAQNISSKHQLMLRGDRYGA